MLSHQDLTALTLPVLQLAVEAGQAIVEVYQSDDLQVEHKADFSPLTLADRRAHDIIDAGLVALAPDVPVLSEEGRDIPWSEREGWDELWLVDPLDGTKEFIKGNGEFTVNIGLVQNGEPVFGVIYAPVRGVAYAGICHRDDAPARDQVFPAPGAYRFVVNGARPADVEALVRAAEPITGSAPDGRSRVSMIGSRSHIGLRTSAFMNRVGRGFDEVKLMHIGSSLKLCMVAEGSAHLYPRFWPTMEWDTAAGHALIRAAGGEVWQAPRDGHKPVPDWLADDPVDPARASAAADPGDTAGPEGVGATIIPVRYNKKDLRNGPFVARGW